jgi:hypothetical protein
MNALVAWETAEGTAAKFNPLATTRKAQGSYSYNSVGVQNYASLGSGISATWLTLEEKGFGYEAIVNAITNNLPAKDILEAVAASAWGTGWLALQVLPYVKANYDNYAARPIGQ